MTYGEFMARAEAGEIAAIASIGTAGILNRAQRLVMVDENNAPCGEMRAQPEHPMYKALGRARRPTGRSTRTRPRFRRAWSCKTSSSETFQTRARYPVDNRPRTPYQASHAMGM
jgi:hypothetical protein